ncbi:hypothetical protein WOLCODRAFT_80132 [Wolfiporia cocos MD-104 SS10]|uniref:NADH dehydrogenase [ubiquinone] 1 alpha subcomplex subunit n=1 Tax=Wolfiporia cocos (strain MD-104) TaxID=742152 RepID=A0A2H3JC43_WOLCO|nr:hypothetical protein WOLCODRAFT_80132 [Wolfiporia cocos MD-104 SS10]
MSFLRRLWQQLRAPRYYVGRDLEGTAIAATLKHPGRTKRVVKYHQGVDMLDYVGGSRRLPIQWTSWLTHTRSHPPGLEELHADLERQKRVQYNVAVIEARDREERERQVSAQEALPVVQQAHRGPPRLESHNAPVGPVTASGSELEAPHQPRQSQDHQPPSAAADELQAWIPRTLRRG